MWIVARSISRPVRERLHGGRFDALVLAVFEHACDLITHDGDVVALVTSQVGDGPLNIVVDGGAGLFAGVDLGAPVALECRGGVTPPLLCVGNLEVGLERAAVTLEGRGGVTPPLLCVGNLEVGLERAAVWEPRPDWEALRSRRSAIISCLPLLRALCLSYAPAGSLLALLVAPPPDDVSPWKCQLVGVPAGDRNKFRLPSSKKIMVLAREAAESLRLGWEGDLEYLREGAAGLAGLGGGLTPAGDDFITGAMLWAHLAHPTPSSLCRALVEVAAPRTTTLSAAFLRAAGRGECSAAWHALLAALNAGTEDEIAAATREVLAHGATSGADSLAGFLYYL